MDRSFIIRYLAGKNITSHESFDSDNYTLQLTMNSSGINFLTFLIEGIVLTDSDLTSYMIPYGAIEELKYIEVMSDSNFNNLLDFIVNDKMEIYKPVDTLLEDSSEDKCSGAVSYELPTRKVVLFYSLNPYLDRTEVLEFVKVFDDLEFIEKFWWRVGSDELCSEEH